MKFSRIDYQTRIIDQLRPEFGGIPIDEPVFLLRAQDVNAAEVVRFWAFLAHASGADPHTVDSAERQAAAMKAWPVKKTPDLPASQ